MNLDVVNLILANVVVSGIISTAMSYFVSVKLKDLDYRNEYYKQIIERRLNAYQNLEKPISELKGILLDTTKLDQEPYHMFMSIGKSGFYEFLACVMNAFSDNLWLDDETNDNLEHLNQVLLVIGNEISDKSDEEIVHIGKNYYDKLSETRFHLENSMKQGLYNLHDVKKGLKIKKHRKKRIIYSSINT